MVPARSGLENQHGRARKSPANEGNHTIPFRAAGYAVRASWFAVCFFVLSAAACAQISPGPLARPHQSLNGATNCSSCHKFGGQAALKCLDCHAEIGAHLRARKGLHATYNI